MIGLTVIFHAVLLDFAIKHLRKLEIFILKRSHLLWKPLFLAMTVLYVFTLHVIEIWGWAFLLLSIEALPTLESALYFSISSFTTVGFGDVVPSKEWRLLGSIVSANGIMLFAWSAAFTFEILSKLYRKEGDVLGL